MPYPSLAEGGELTELPCVAQAQNLGSTGESQPNRLAPTERPHPLTTQA